MPCLAELHRQQYLAALANSQVKTGTDSDLLDASSAEAVQSEANSDTGSAGLEQTSEQKASPAPPPKKKLPRPSIAAPVKPSVPVKPSGPPPSPSIAITITPSPTKAEPTGTGAGKSEKIEEEKSNKSKGKVIMIARKSHVSKKASVMSFVKGDSIEMLDDSKKWHKGNPFITPPTHTHTPLPSSSPLD